MEVSARAGQAVDLTSRKNEDKEEFDEEEGWCEHYSITEVFPDELLFAIFSYLGWRDLVHVAQTCTTLRDLCDDSRLWSQLWHLDFTQCVSPSHRRVLDIAKRCSSARVLRLDLNLRDDQFVEILSACPHLHTFQMKNATDLGNASLFRIIGLSDGLKSLSVSGSNFIENVSVRDVLESHADSLEELYLNRCSGVRYLQLSHRHAPHTLAHLTKVTVKNMQFDENNLTTLSENCRSVRHLCLSGSTLTQFTMDELGDGLLDLIFLDLTDCDLLEIVRLQGLVELETLYCSNSTSLVEVTSECSKVKQVLVSRCSDLKKFRLSSEEISTLDLSGLQRLTTVSLLCANLSDLNVSGSSRIPILVLQSLIRQHPKLQKLNVHSCTQFHQEDLERLVATVQSVSILHCGGIALEDFNFTSQCISSLSLGHIVELPFVGFSSPALHELSIHHCSDISEEHFIEGIVYGDRVRKTRGSSPPKHTVVNRLGAPNLVDLTISHVPNVSGKALSQIGGSMTSLRTLTVRDSYFFKELSLTGWPSIETVEITACTRFNSVDIRHCPKLRQLSVLYCSDVSEVSIEAETLETFHTDGSSFSNLHLASDQLTALELDSIMASASSSLELKCPNLHQLKVTRCRELDNELMSGITSYSSSLSELAIEGSNRITTIDIPASVTSLELNGLRRLTDIRLQPEAQINILHLCGLPKLTAQTRHDILQLASPHMKELKISGIPKVPEMTLAFEHIESLLVDQVLNLTQLAVICPKLRTLGLQGCPHLTTLRLEVEKLHQLRVASRSHAIQSLRKLHLVSRTARFLSRILEQYCPRLVELILTGAVVSVARLRSASRKLRYLKAVHLDGCTLEVSCSDRMDDPNRFIVRREQYDLEFPSATVEVSLSDTVIVQDQTELMEH